MSVVTVRKSLRCVHSTKAMVRLDIAAASAEWLFPGPGAFAWAHWFSLKAHIFTSQVISVKNVICDHKANECLIGT
jgi:hypothetical protein